MDEATRNHTFTVGKLAGNLATKCVAISEDHLVFQFKKDRDMEEYEIQISRNGPVLYKHPRMNLLSKMEAKEKLESYEIIGKKANFRISDKIVKGGMANFIELSLSCAFYITKLGKERLKFTISVNKIVPGLNPRLMNKDGLYPWGKNPDDSDEEEHAEES